MALCVLLVHLVVCVRMKLQCCPAVLDLFRKQNQLFVQSVLLEVRAVPPVSQKTELIVHLDLLRSKGRPTVLSAQLVISATTLIRILEHCVQREHFQVQGRVHAGPVHLVSFVLMVQLKHVRLELPPQHDLLHFPIACCVLSVILPQKVRLPFASNVQLGTLV